MGRKFSNTLLFAGIFLLLFAKNPLYAKAATASECLPHIDAFTFAEGNHADLPQASEYTNMIIADVTDFVNVRLEPNTESGITGRIYSNAVAKIIKYSPIDDSWIEIESADVTGYVKAEYFLTGETAVNIIENKIQNGEELTYARSMDEILAERTATEDLRQSIVDFALQYVGNPYVHGGNSLTEGTDCSGFTSLVFAEFGYSLSRTPSGQLSSNGTKIEYSAIRPGDIICYTSNGKTCTHVAIYIGDGQIVHAANSKKGIITNNADYSTIIGVKNIIG